MLSCSPAYNIHDNPATIDDIPAITKASTMFSSNRKRNQRISQEPSIDIVCELSSHKTRCFKLISQRLSHRSFLQVVKNAILAFLQLYQSYQRISPHHSSFTPNTKPETPTNTQKSFTMTPNPTHHPRSSSSSNPHNTVPSNWEARKKPHNQPAQQSTISSKCTHERSDMPTS